VRGLASELRARITGTGFFVPERVVTNQEIVESGVDTSDEWIWEKIGVKTRRWISDGEQTSDLAAKAGEMALENAGIGADELDAVIVTTILGDRITPATACIVQEKIGAKKAAAFDINNACAGFIYGIEVASKLIEGKSFEKILLIGADTPSRLLQKDRRTTYVIFGDGAGAVVLEKSEKGRGVIGSYLKSDGSGADMIFVPTEFPFYIEMDGKAVKEFAEKAMPDAVNGALKNAGLSLKELDFIVPHQANYNIIKASMDSLGLGMDKTFTNIDKYGNTVGASIPIALHDAVKEGKVKEGSLVALVGFGDGLTWGANIIRW